MTSSLLLAAVLPFPPFWWVLAVPAAVLAAWIAVVVLLVRLAILAGGPKRQGRAVVPRGRRGGSHLLGPDDGIGWTADSGWSTDCGGGFDSSPGAGSDGGSSC
jgi:uncharacterized membrane protein YgcG